MMEVNEGLEGEVALSNGLGLNQALGSFTAYSQRHQPISTCLRALLHELYDPRILPPKSLHPMH